VILWRNDTSFPPSGAGFLENEMNKCFALIAIASLTGCASLVHTADQKVSVLTDDPAADYQTTCQLENKDGKWGGRPLLPVTINRDPGPMQITCTSPTKSGRTMASTSVSWWWAGNIPLLGIFCPLGIIADGLNEADYAYPEQILVPMKARK
jgi:uncharacterized protein YceK